MAVRLSSGSHRGHSAYELRPTASRTLEAVFDILMGEIEDRRVLDLICGRRILRDYVLRRAAKLSVFVESSRSAEKRIQRALTQYHLEERAMLFREDVEHFLHSTHRWEEPFDLIFADPPYEAVSPGPLMDAVLESGLLANDGILIIEHLEAARASGSTDTDIEKVARIRGYNGEYLGSSRDGHGLLMALKTHRVAAAAYIFCDGKLLLLRRANPPKTLVPPGGRLYLDEDPVIGVKREVLEETGMEIGIIGVAHLWFGRITNESEPLLAVNYIAHPKTNDLRLSDEHSEFVWAEREQIRSGEITTTDEQGHGYRKEDLLEAFDLHAKLTV